MRITIPFNERGIDGIGKPLVTLLVVLAKHQTVDEHKDPLFALRLELSFIQVDQLTVRHNAEKPALPERVEFFFQGVARMIVKGKALVTLDGTPCIVETGRTIDIPVGVAHRIQNEGPETLVFIEIQTGEYFGGIVKLFFDEKKITIKGKIRRGLIPDSMKAAKPLYTWESPPLWEIVADMMKFSTNLSAEMLFKTFSAVRDSGGGSWEKSSEMMQAWWKEKGLPGCPIMKNGSGMGDCNRFTVSQLAALLNFTWNQKTFFPEYLNAFSIAGNDGTLRSRFKGSRLKGRVRGKTGTLNEFGVYSMAGYVLMPKADYIFVIVFNNIGSKFPYHHWEMQQKILEMLVPE